MFQFVSSFPLIILFLLALNSVSDDTFFIIAWLTLVLALIIPLLVNFYM